MFSEDDIQKIKNPKSEKDFRDVLQAYYLKKYKACILLLHNLVINDLYEKLNWTNDLGFTNLNKDITRINKFIGENSFYLAEDKIIQVCKNKKLLG